MDWPATDWTVDGDGTYSARDTCGRGGGEGHEGDGGGHEVTETDGGHDGGQGGHEGGEGGGEGGEGGGERGSVACVHPVVMRQIATVVPPPPTPPPASVVEPEAEALAPVVTTTAVTAPTVTAPIVQPTIAAVAPSTLAATGGSFTMILLIAGLLVTIGAVAAGVTRPTS